MLHRAVPEPDRMPLLLIVEDDGKIAGALEAGLRQEGYRTRVAPSGEAALRSLESATPDLIVLDLMLPGQDGFAVLRELREHRLRLPVLILSARDRLDDRVAGLDLGADDYLVKPFAFSELSARVRALLRRGQADAQLRLAVADLALDVVAHAATRGGRQLDLTRLEFELLAYLVRHAGQTVSRTMLARDVWRVTCRATPLDNVIEVHIGRLRRKVDGGAEPKLIHTVRGVGYCLSEIEP